MKRIILIVIIAACAAWLGFHTVRAIGRKRAVTASVAPIEQPAVTASEVPVEPLATTATAPPAVELSYEPSTLKAPVVADEEVRSIAVPESRLSPPERGPWFSASPAPTEEEDDEISWSPPEAEPPAQMTTTVATTATVDDNNIVSPPAAATPTAQSTTTVATTTTTSTTATASTEDADAIWTSRNLAFSEEPGPAAAAPAAKSRMAKADVGSFLGKMPAAGKMPALEPRSREEILPSGLVESLALLAKSQRGPMNPKPSAAGDDFPDLESLLRGFPFLHRRVKGAVVINVPPIVFTDAAERASFETETSKLVAASGLSALLVPASLQDVPFYVETVEALRRQLESTAHTTIRPYSYQPGAPIPPAATGIELVVIPAH